MKEHPILFSTPMVQAILEKRKNQTRRTSGLEEINENPSDWKFEWADFILDKPWRFTQLSSINKQSLKDRTFEQAALKCPYGQSGDLLWVRETWMNNPNIEHFPDEPIYYKASQSAQFIKEWPTSWKPSIHMPKTAARVWTEVEKVGVERVADISEYDAKAEGAKKAFRWMHTGEIEYVEKGHITYETASYRLGFKKLWNSINGYPKPSYAMIDGKPQINGYTVYPFDEQSAEPFLKLREIKPGIREWKNRPLTVIVNPWVWVVKFKVLSTTGKPSFDSAQDDEEISPSVHQ